MSCMWPTQQAGTEGREVESNFPEITEAGEQSLAPQPMSPQGVWEVCAVFPTGHKF